MRREISLLMIGAALLACAGRQDRSTSEPIPAGQGRVCVAGSLEGMFVQPLQMATIIEAQPTGERTCVATPPGRAMVVFEQAEHERAFVDAWIDAGQTTTIEPGPTTKLSATAAETEAITRLLQAGRCSMLGCTISNDELARIEAATRSASMRERQTARLLVWELRFTKSDDEAAKRELAAAIWAELEATPMIAAAFPGALVAAARALGQQPHRELEDAVIAAQGVAASWSPPMRSQVLLTMVLLAGVGAETDGLRARIRAALAAEPALLENPFGRAALREAGFDRHVIAQGEIVVRGVVEPFAGRPCEPGSRWLVYIHSSTCSACKPALRRVTALLEQGDPRLHVLAVPAYGAPPPIVERPKVEQVELVPGLEDWMQTARGGVVTPYFMGLVCDESTSLRLVGFGGLDDATDWDARAVEEP